MIESLLEIWKRHESAKGLDNWWRFPHSDGAHDRMKAEARRYAQNLLREESPELWPIFARGDVGDLHDLWLERYAAQYDGEVPGGTEQAHPSAWADGAAAEYVEEYNRPHDDCNHIRGVGVVALQYFAEYAAAALERYGVDFCKRTPSERRENDQRTVNELRETKPGGIVLPLELDTDRARAAFAEAIARGWMVEASNGYEWRGVDGRGGWGANSQLAYFCGCIYGYKWGADKWGNGYAGNVGEELNYDALERLFSVRNMSETIRQVHNRDKPQAWRKIIDRIFI